MKSLCPRRRWRTGALALATCAALAAPAAAEPGADYPVPTAPKIGDTPADFPGMPDPRDLAQLAAPREPDSGGLDWPSVAIGAAGAGVLIVLTLGGVALAAKPRSTHRIHGGSLLVVAIAGLALVPAARGDTVSDWNLNATNALIVTAGQPPPVAMLHLGMVHGAVYDAVNAIDGRYAPYLVAPRARSWYSKDAAAATAAYRVLASIVPAQQPTLASLYDATLAGVPAGRAKDGGVAVGEAAAAAMIAARANDGRFGPPGFPVGTAAGQRRPTLPSFVNDPNAWVATVKPFLIEDPSEFRSGGPNTLTGRRYAREFEEVKSLGSATSSARTAEQTDIARFWAEHPPAMWSRIFRQLSAAGELGIDDNARFFAMLYLTSADAVISCWDDKAHWLFWRPITAIREAASDGNPETEPDASWLPLIATPPYPDHPSGHACLSSSVVATLRDFFGNDHAAFSATSAVSGTTRSFTRFSQAIEEIIDARVYSGLHFRTADVDGARIGAEVARWRAAHTFKPEHDHDHDHDQR